MVVQSPTSQQVAFLIGSLLLIGCLPAEDRDDAEINVGETVAIGEQLTGSMLERLIVGKTISNRELIEPNFVTFGESFEVDGTWFASFQTRGPTQLRGRWRIINDELCVEPESGAEQCRIVRVGEGPGVYETASSLPRIHNDRVKFEILEH